MPTRAEHLEDIRERLSGKIATVGDKVYRARVKTLGEGQLPAICLYAPDEDGTEPVVTGGHPQYRPFHTLAIEIRVKHGDGFDVAAGQIVEAVKQLLFTDSDWRARFAGHARYRVRQFLDHRGETAFCGEVLTLTVQDARPTEYKPGAPELALIHFAQDVDGDGAPDVEADVTP